MHLSDLRYFNPNSEITRTRNSLPHWQQSGAVYFVTFHLQDSVPAPLLARWTAEREAWLMHHPLPWSSTVEEEYHQRFSHSMEKWLDAGHGSCALREPAVRGQVATALGFFDEHRCRQLSWVVMPNHVHALFVLHPDWELHQIIRSWKRHSARAINQQMGRTGALWQKDYFDRLIRDPGHLANCVRYIRRNPSKAKLGANAFTLWESGMVEDLVQ